MARRDNVKTLPTTSRDATEQVPRVSEAQLRLIMDDLPALIVYYDAEQRYRFVNYTFESWFQRPRADVIGRRMRDVVGRTIYERLRPHVEAALRGERQDFETSITFPDGESRVLELTYVPQVSGDGRVQGFFLLGHDVSAREQAHEALRASAAQMRQLTDAMPAVIAYCDAEYRYRFANRTFETWFRKSRADIIGNHARDVLGRGPYEELRPHMEKALLGEHQVFEANFSLPDGVTRDLELTYVPHVLEDGSIPGFFLMVRDVTEQNRDKEALRASEERLAGILDIARDAVISMDEMHRITLFNQGAEATFGYAADEVQGQLLDVLMPERFREFHGHHLRRFACATVKSRMMIGRGEIVGLRKDGSEFPAEASISQLELGGETVFTVMLRDITERTAAQNALLESERELQTRVEELESAHAALERQGEELVRMTEDLAAARDQAEDANRAKSEFLAHMSHELRTPLNAVIGFSEIIKMETFGPVGSAKYREYATDINLSGQHLLDLINDILDLSKVESGSEELHEQDIDVSALIRSVWTLIEKIAETGKVALESEVPDALAWLRADERKIKQILLNALSNAIKFTEAGGKVTLRAWCNADSGFVFQVCDTGIGIAPEDIPKALSKFGRIDGELNRSVKGTGLGLPLTKALVELHGGTLTLQSELGVGTTLTVGLPASRIVHRNVEPAQDD